MKLPARTIQLFLIDGDPKYRIKATVSNWTGLVLLLPRTCLDWKPSRSDLNQTGVYLLFGRNEDTQFDQVYIGQSCERDNGNGIAGRLAEHMRDPRRDYFTHVIVVTTQNDSFGPTELNYLEHVFYKLAKQAGRYEVTNGPCPAKGKVTEEKEAELNEFITFAQIVIGSLGYKVFDPLDGSHSGSGALTQEAHPPQEEKLTMRYKDVVAYARQSPDGIVILQGSQINPNLTASCPDGVRLARKKLADFVGKDMRTTQDLLFSSPSAAASFVAGASQNGLTQWVLPDGRTLKQAETDESQRAATISNLHDCQ
ncbi:GIY-YIG nuclease family protein [Corynebacterium choanae]|uniref:DUF4357 domain-containing protein n=1 Tax=Corynebacterium choanae TaxID=1862358 RepID=A0A3G6J9W0_9CORY|nr:GIY-YIG nuclease family protein [Corynebacterium choanae]AZA14689.1 hypothetical protein CCHOA_11590 [Corynebacterium choanae]